MVGIVAYIKIDGTLDSGRVNNFVLFDRDVEIRSH